MWIFAYVNRYVLNNLQISILRIGGFNSDKCTKEGY